MAEVNGRRPWRFRLLYHTPWLALVALFLLSRLPGCHGVMQPGPMAARGHQGLMCQQCHPGGTGLARQTPQGSLAMDRACLSCHQGHKIHHLQQVAHRTPRCLHCHREHHGREELTRVADYRCRSCHANLQREDGLQSSCLGVPDWIGHPEFTSVRVGAARGTRRLHFSHQAHLQPEGILGRDRKPVRLECGMCHQPDAAGRYMEPVRYETSCAFCHPLSVQVAVTREGPAAEAFRRQPARHAEPREVQADLRERLVRLVQQAPELLRRESFGEKRWPLRRPEAAAEEKQWDWVERQLDGLNHRLFTLSGGCKFCHMAAPPKDGVPSLTPTGLPARALVGAFFNHHSHREVGCATCHAAASRTSPRESAMPSVAVCHTCHRDSQPRRPSEVRAACAGCHTYHTAAQKRRETVAPLPR